MLEQGLMVDFDFSDPGGTEDICFLGKYGAVARR